MGDFMKKIYLATADSRNFSFQAIAATEKEARSILLSGLRLHEKEYNLEPNWWDEWATINVQPLEVGKVYRDSEPMKINHAHI